MVVFDTVNYHLDYMDVIRYWAANSEAYAGGDALLTLLDNDWEMQETVFFEEYWHAGSRPVTIYHVELRRGDETQVMRLLDNPYVRRLMRNSTVQLRPIAQRDVLRTWR